ncbi:MAG: GGDEF domain-containing phosphodiesterase [Lachnospiraceae bacterium]|nr:GGDEF domain-containing phosphodiesterase [Lachnospiraceae bacterium]
MKSVSFNGREYTEPSAETQKGFGVFDIYSFRYYPQDNVVILSDECCAKFGCKKVYPTNLGVFPKELVYDGDKEKYTNFFNRIKSGEDNVSENVRSVDGKTSYRISMGVLEKDNNGRPVVVSGMIQNHDEHIRMLEHVQLLTGDYENVFLVDFETNDIEVFRAQEHIDKQYGEMLQQKHSFEKIMAKYIKDYVFDEEKIEMAVIFTRKNIERKLMENNLFTHDFRILRNEKTEHIRIKVVNVSDNPSSLKRAVIGFANVSKEKNVELMHLAYDDAITGGRNFTFFNESLKQVNNEGTIVTVDIKSFKIVNEVCGMSKGDVILRHVSDIIEKQVEGKGFYGHLNADHFIVFLDTTKEDEVKELLENITENVEALVVLFDIPKISAYFGVTRWRVGMRTNVAISEANTAKHNIKGINGPNLAFYRHEDLEKTIEEKQMEDSFEEALKRHQFEVWYQPKFSPVGHDMIGAEALIRWRKKDGTLVYPNRFIPVFERDGMIPQLDEYVFRAVCEQQKEWLDKFGKTVPISINVSRASLFFDKIVDRYRQIAEDVGVPSELVPLEITESMAETNDMIRDMANKFNDTGFPIHIDDFGTGYSSLSSLNMMKFDTLKIDKSLVDYIGNVSGDSLIKHTIALAKELGFHVTAEGVETKEQVAFLRDHACDSIQGFYYAKPMHADNFMELLAG